MLLCVCLCLCVFVRVGASMLLHILFLHIHPHKHTLTVYTNPFELVVGAVFVSFISLFFHLTPYVGIYPHNFLPISSTITFARSFVLDRLSSKQSCRELPESLDHSTKQLARALACENEPACSQKRLFLRSNSQQSFLSSVHKDGSV